MMTQRLTLSAQAYMQLRTAVTQRYGELQQLRAQGVAAAAAGIVEPTALNRVETAQAAWEHQLELLAKLRLRYVNSVPWSVLEVAHELTALLGTPDTTQPLRVRSITPAEFLWLVVSAITYAASRSASVTLVVVLVAVVQVTLRRQAEIAAHYSALDQAQRVRRDAIETKRQRLCALMELPVAHEVLSALEERYQQERVPHALQDAIQRAEEAARKTAEEAAAAEAKAAAEALAAAERQRKAARRTSTGVRLEDDLAPVAVGTAQYAVTSGSHWEPDPESTRFNNPVWEPEPMSFDTFEPAYNTPEFNTNGIPMVSNSFVDVQGHTFGQDW